MKRVRRYNQLVPEVGGQPMPPRAKMTEEWCKKFLMKSIDQGGTIDAETLAAESAFSEHIIRAAIAAAKSLGRDHVAYLLFRHSVDMATPGRSGRRSGSGTHTRAQLDHIMAAVLTHDDGSPSGRRRAIAAAVAHLPLHQRDATKKWLRRNLPPPRMAAALDTFRT